VAIIDVDGASTPVARLYFTATFFALCSLKSLMCVYLFADCVRTSPLPEKSAKIGNLGHEWSLNNF